MADMQNASRDDDEPEATKSTSPEDEEATGGLGSYARCATCQHASDIDLERGVLLCNRFEMYVDAEADEIPDDCLEYKRDPGKQPPPDPTDSSVDVIAPSPEET